MTPDGQRRYKHKSREVPRPVAEQVTLPADVAPALVSRELADAVHARLAWNREHAAALISSAAERGQYDYQALLAGGFPVCGGGGAAPTADNPATHSRPATTPPPPTSRPCALTGSATARPTHCPPTRAPAW